MAHLPRFSMPTHDDPIPANEQQASEQRLKKWRGELDLLLDLSRRILLLTREVEVRIAMEEQRLGILAIDPQRRSEHEASG